MICIGSEQIIFKMDRFGNGEEIVLDNIFDSAALKPSFQNFDKELFTGESLLRHFELFSVSFKSESIS